MSRACWKQALATRETGRFPLASAYNIHYAGYMESTTAIAALSALAQSTRLETFRLLVKHEPGGLPAGVSTPETNCIVGPEQ
jgi:hypothetical protein